MPFPGGARGGRSEHEPVSAGPSELEVRLVTFAISARIDDATVVLVNELAGRGLSSVVLKGPALASWLYEQPAERNYADLDLLVDSRRLDAVRAVLTQLGYARLTTSPTQYDRPHHDEPWQGDIMIELHPTLSGVRAPATAVWDTLASHTEDLPLVAGTVRVLSPAGRALVVALHAAHHGAGLSQPLEDLRRAVAQLPAQEWQAAAGLATELDAVAAFRSGLMLVERGPGLLAQLRLPPEMTVEASLNAVSAPPMAHALNWLRGERLDRREKAVFVARKLIPPPDFLRSVSPLAQRGPLGLGAAYVIRICGLVAGLPAGARALRRARRRAEDEA